MNWDAISAISQLVGSIAVVLSVLYLAVQVHRSTRVAKLATQDSAATALRDVTKPLMENAELERIWQSSGKTVMLITHSISEAIFLADRDIVLSSRPGRVLRDLRISIPRPRTFDTIVSHPDYAGLAREIRGLLNAQGEIE